MKPDDHPRVQALIELFQRIDAGMRDIPIYNGKIAVEAIGFRPFGEGEVLGVVLTPWFMNMITLPIEPVPMNMAEIGRAVSVELPAGKRAFVVGGDEAIGLYKAHSLHSPVLSFTLPGQAQAEARRMLASLMTPPDVTAETAARTGSGTNRLDRRALLFGQERLNHREQRRITCASQPQEMLPTSQRAFPRELSRQTDVDQLDEHDRDVPPGLWLSEGRASRRPRF